MLVINMEAYSIIYFRKKTSVLSTVYRKCGHEYIKLFKEEESIEIVKILGLINNIQENIIKKYIIKHIIIPEESMNQGFRLKKIDEIRNYLIEDISRYELISKNHKKVCRVLNYIDHSLIVIFAITWCVSISAFSCLVGIPIGITSSAIGLKVCLITTGIKKYKSINKTNKKKHNKIILLAKSKWSNIEVLISKVLIHSNISYMMNSL